jgi:hypothetical protein
MRSVYAIQRKLCHTPAIARIDQNHVKAAVFGVAGRAKRPRRH